MGQTTAETVKEIEATRSRLDSEFRELEARLPAPAVWAKRLVGLAVGGGVVTTLLIATVKRMRGSREQKELREIHRKLDRLEARLQQIGPAR
jgi:hypothetical protein